MLLPDVIFLGGGVVYCSRNGRMRVAHCSCVLVKGLLASVGGVQLLVSSVSVLECAEFSRQSSPLERLVAFLFGEPSSLLVVTLLLLLQLLLPMCVICVCVGVRTHAGLGYTWTRFWIAFGFAMLLDSFWFCVWVLGGIGHVGSGLVRYVLRLFERFWSKAYFVARKVFWLSYAPSLRTRGSEWLVAVAYRTLG